MYGSIFIALDLKAGIYLLSSTSYIFFLLFEKQHIYLWKIQAKKYKEVLRSQNPKLEYIVKVSKLKTIAHFS